MDLSKAFDRYTLQARILPTLIVLFPFSSLIIVWLPDESVGWRMLSGLVSLILLSLLAQVGRDSGKWREGDLFRKWGGSPSIRKLRHTQGDLSWITAERLRARLGQEVGVAAPTPADEQRDPGAADEVYAAYVDHMREATRGDRILFAENISYGFRRNLWGMRAAGVAASVVGSAGAGIAAALAWGTEAMVVPIAILALNAALLSLWSLRVDDRWVRDAAEAYADRLLRAYLANSGGAEVPSSNAASSPPHAAKVKE